MIKGKIIYIILGVIIVTALFLRIFSKEDTWLCVNGSWTKHGNPSSQKPNQTCPRAEVDGREQFILEATTSTMPTSTISTSSIEEVTSVVINSPQPEQVVSSPLVVKGQALGSWFFEASLPIRLLDNKGQLIASTPASAESNWMLSDLVPFSALLEFNTIATSGYLVIAKDNPSGLAVNEDSRSIPVKFLNK